MKFLYRVYPLLAVSNCVQDGTRSQPNGAAETLRHQEGENKERKTRAFLYKGIYFHHIALSRSFPMRIFSADNLVYYASK